MKNEKLQQCIFAILFLTPTFTFAQSPNFHYFNSAVVSVGELVAQLIPIVIAIGLLSFIWGLVQFIMSLGDEDSKEVGKRRMVWGIITLFVIVSVWGIVNLLNEITGIQMGGTIEIPTVPLD
jgi:hypothetical protein